MALFNVFETHANTKTHARTHIHTQTHTQAYTLTGTHARTYKSVHNGYQHLGRFYYLPSPITKSIKETWSLKCCIFTPVTSDNIQPGHIERARDKYISHINNSHLTNTVSRDLSLSLSLSLSLTYA